MKQWHGKNRNCEKGGSRKGLMFLLAAELLLLLLLLPGLWEKNVPQELFSGEVAETLDIALPMQRAGVYRIVADYQAAEGSISALQAVNQDNIYKGIYTNEMTLPGAAEGRAESRIITRATTLWLTGKTDQLHLQITPGENAGLHVEHLTLTRTNQGALVGILCVLLLGVPVDILCLYGYRRRPGAGDAGAQRLTAWAVAGIVLLTSLPLLTDYCLAGEELTFHLLRIEGLKEGLLAGQLPVRFQPNWLEGAGYAVSLFEGDTFLLFPALLRMAGFPVQTAWRLALLGLNGAAAVIAYLCIQRSFGDRRLGLLGSMLYCSLPCRLDALYAKADYGESAALCFLPLVFYGFYQLLNPAQSCGESRPAEGSSAGKSLGQKAKGCPAWLWAALGLTCLFQAHITTFEIAALLVFLLVLLCWRQAFNRRGLLELCKVGVTFLILNAWMIVPLLDYLLNKDIWIKVVGAEGIQHRGIYLQHLFLAFPGNGDVREFTSAGIQGTAPLTWGIAVTLLLLFGAWVLFTGRYREARRASARWHFAKKAAVAGGVLLFMSTRYFPWDVLRGEIPVVCILTAGLQAPAELLPGAAVCFIFLGCALVELTGRRDGSEAARSTLLLAGILCISFVTTQFLVGDLLRKREPLRIYAGESLDTSQIGRGEYLLLDTAQGARGEHTDPNIWYWRASEAVSLCGAAAMGIWVITVYRKKSGREGRHVEEV